MVTYITARHIGESDAFYQRGRTYPIAVKVGFFTRKVKIYARRGYYDNMIPDSHRVYKNIETFENVWIDIKEENR